MADNQNVRWADGTLDFSLGVDSNRPSTLVSDNNPNGLPRNAYAWGNNVTTRGGGLIQRTGWQPIATLHDSTGLYQGGFMYDQQTNRPDVTRLSRHRETISSDGKRVFCNLQHRITIEIWRSTCAAGSTYDVACGVLAVLSVPDAPLVINHRPRCW